MAKRDLATEFTENTERKKRTYKKSLWLIFYHRRKKLEDRIERGIYAEIRRFKKISAKFFKEVTPGYASDSPF
jgi:hypothetical protein